jgi:hypothetical protein
LSEIFGNRCLELRIARAYMHLAFVPPRGDGAKAVSLARFGDYEVLLNLRKVASPIIPNCGSSCTITSCNTDSIAAAAPI